MKRFALWLVVALAVGCTTEEISVHDIASGNEPGGDGDTDSGGVSDTGFDTVTDQEPSVLFDPTLDLNERIEIVDIALSGPVGVSSGTYGYIFPAPRLNGGLTLGWNSEEQAHFTRLNADMVQEGTDWILDNQVIVELIGLPDDGILAMVTDYTTSLFDNDTVDRQLRLVRFDANGNQVASVLILGGDGIGVDATWYAWTSIRSVDVVPNGDRFMIFTEINHNTGEPENVTLSDLYIEVDSAGNLDEPTRRFPDMGASHRLHLAVGPLGEGLTLTVGGSSPYGVIYTNRATSEEQIVWPPEDQLATGAADITSVIDAGDLCGFTRRGDRLFATVGTVREQPFSWSYDIGDIVLLSWLVDGGDVNVTWLTNSADIAERCPSLTPMVDYQLSVWGLTHNKTATLALLDSQGNLVNGPTSTSAPYHSYSLVVPLSNGNIVWTYAQHNENTAQIVIVRP